MTIPTFTMLKLPQFKTRSLKHEPAFTRTDKDFTPPYLVAQVGDSDFAGLGFIGVPLELPRDLGQDALLERAAYWCARLQWRFTVFVVFDETFAVKINPEGTSMLVHREDVWFVAPAFAEGAP